jgi:hypothetical protein
MKDGVLMIIHICVKISLRYAGLFSASRADNRYLTVIIVTKTGGFVAVENGYSGLS